MFTSSPPVARARRRGGPGGRRWGLQLALIACVTALPVVPARADDDLEPDDPEITTSAPANDEAHGLLFDERLAMIAARVPEFGTLYVDEAARTLVVHVTERRPQTVADLRRALREAFPGEKLPGRIRLVDGQFSFEQLNRWHERARQLFTTMDEVVLLDVDDRTNRLRIGVDTASAAPELAQRLAAMSIPPEGWRMDEVEPVDPISSVTDRHRPVMGGLQIQIGSAAGGFCTYGLTATRNGVNGFITNSHCTTTEGGVESTQLAQPAFAADGANTNTIATETVDPAFITGGVCPVGARCRYSDSAFAQRSASASRAIARTSIGSLAWDGSSRYYVVSEQSPFVGLALRKMGRTSGHTVGLVESTCADIWQNGTNNLMLCQADASFTTLAGDSGSPVFRTLGCTVSGAAGSCADAYGLVWGGGGVFSPIANIQRSSELGAIDVCAIAGGC